MPRSVRAAILLPLLLLLGCQSLQAAPARAALRRVATLATVEQEPPTAFLPLADGGLLFLDATRKRLACYRSGKLVSDAPLMGSDFEPHRARLLDVVEESPGKLLVLDAGAGTIWRTGLDGEITGRFGMLVAPVRIGRGADGRIWVVDAGTARVVGFRRGRAELTFPLDGWAAPFATRKGEVPVIDWTEDGVAELGLMNSEGRSSLTRLVPPEGLELMEARVVGVHGKRLWVEVLLGHPEADKPAGTRLLEIATDGPKRGARRVLEVPTLLNQCLDCGADFRVGPDGSPWLYRERTGQYGIYRLGEEVAR